MRGVKAHGQYPQIINIFLMMASLRAVITCNAWMKVIQKWRKLFHGNFSFTHCSSFFHTFPHISSLFLTFPHFFLQNWGKLFHGNFSFLQSFSLFHTFPHFSSFFLQKWGSKNEEIYSSHCFSMFPQFLTLPHFPSLFSLSKSEESYSMAIFHYTNVSQFSTCFLTFPHSSSVFLMVLLGTWRYFWVLESTFGYLQILLGTWRYFWVPEGTFGYLMVLFGTWWYFWVIDGTFGYLTVQWALWTPCVLVIFFTCPHFS